MSKSNGSLMDKENHSSSSTNTYITETDTGSNYFIIVGVYEVKDVAEKTLSSLKEKGFMNASMLKRAGRLDVYSASFNDESEASDFLKKFRAENPKYHDAWLLKR